MLKTGWIDYANCTPLLLQIKDNLESCGISLVHGVPAVLNGALAEGSIDICISSSIEFARRTDRYLVLPGHCIGSEGPVQSVMLFSNSPVDQLNGADIHVTVESATSVALLEILLRRYWKVRDFRLEACPPDWQRALSGSQAVMLIGDAALKAGITGGARYSYDLGEEWFRFTGLPFVFALWQVSQGSAVRCRSELASLLNLLDGAVSTFPDSFDELARGASESSWIGADRLAEYWKKITYRLDDRHLAGLNLYYLMASELGLIESVPRLKFLKIEG